MQENGSGIQSSGLPGKRWISSKFKRLFSLPPNQLHGHNTPTPAVEDIGPTVLCDGGDDPNADIIFVHGLMGNSLKTWQKNCVLWPKTLLGSKFPNARIITYGYDAHVARWFSPTSKNHIFDHSKGLVQDILTLRRAPNEMNRPIIFVAHSLGGILVKDGLIWSKDQEGFSNDHTVFECTRGIVFLGTPHRGASGGFADFGVILQRMTSTFLHESTRHLVSSLKDDSETLSRLADAFGRLLVNRNFVIHSFTEELPMSTVKGIGQVVDQSSGYLGDPQEKKRTIHANHQDMCRFSHATDSGYIKVESAIEDCYKYATEKVTLHETSSLGYKNGTHIEIADTSALVTVQKRSKIALLPSMDSGEDLLERLQEAAYFTQEVLLQLRHTRLKSSCLWLETECGFKGWLESGPPFLWLCGPPGFGKTHLASKVVDIIENEAKMDPKGPILVYFFCDISDTHEGSLIRAIATMAGQIASQDDSYSRKIKEVFQLSWLRNSDPSFPLLWRELIETKIPQERRIYMIIDGLDQWDRKERQEFLKCAYRLATNTRGRFRLFISSRPEVLSDVKYVGLEEDHPPTIPTITLTEQTAADINRYIISRIRHMDFADDEQTCSKVQFSLSSTAGGMFLWAHLKLEKLSHAYAIEDIEEFLNTLPEGRDLDRLYGDMLLKLSRESSTSQINVINEVLAWATYGLESFDLDMLGKAIKVKLDIGVLSLRRELKRCGSLFQITQSPLEDAAFGANKESDCSDESGSDISLADSDPLPVTWTSYLTQAVIQIRHSTLLEYLKRSPHDGLIRLQQHDDVHTSLAITCMDAIIGCVSDIRLDSFQKYALQYWGFHLARANLDKEFQTLVPKLVKLFSDWHITKRWLARLTQTGFSNLVCVCASLSLSGSYITLRDPSERALDPERHSIPQLRDVLVQGALSNGFFEDFPKLHHSQDILDYRHILRSLVWFSSTEDHLDSNIPQNALWKRIDRDPLRNFVIAEVLLEEDQVQLAQSYYAKAIEMQGNEPAFYYGYCMALAASGDAKALEAAKKCRDLYIDRGENDRLSEVLLTVGIMQRNLKEEDEMQISLQQACELRNREAVDELLKFYSNSGNLQQWIKLLMGAGSDGRPPKHNTCVHAIRRQRVLSQWHTTFCTAAHQTGQMAFLVRSYKRVISIAKRHKQDLFLKWGCQLWLGRAYVYVLGREKCGIAQWRLVASEMERVRFRDNEQNYLLLLVLEEISCHPQEDVGLLLHGPTYAGNESKEFLNWARKLIFTAKGIEDIPGERTEAIALYHKVAFCAIEWINSKAEFMEGYEILGSTLLALGERNHAARALTICYGAGYSLACDNCVSKTHNPKIFGRRYTCSSCFEIDLCSECYSDRMFGLIESGPRNCQRNHKFIRIPDSKLEKETEFIEADSPRVRKWFDEIRALMKAQSTQADAQGKNKETDGVEKSLDSNSDEELD